MMSSGSLTTYGSNKNTQVRKYHGLRNQGSTCYLNSGLQVLFMTEDFREAVGRCPKHYEDPIDHQLNTLFENLKERTGETYEVTEKLGIDKVNEQRDAGEYLENILSLASKEASKIFDVQLIYRTICLDCKQPTDEEKSFWNLPLPLKNSSDQNYSVVEAIQDFFKDSHFTEDNQLYCETCQDKRDSVVKCVVKRHPEVLMLLLKRFEFNYYQMCYVKNTRVVDVPRIVQIPQNQVYELYGFVEHFGCLKSGHYTATIKSQDGNRWYNFNDSSVTELNNPPFKGNKIERSRSAYLLFYRKKGTDHGDNTKESYKGGLVDNNKNSSCRPDAIKNKKGEDDAERNKKRAINSPNGEAIEESSDPSNKRVFDKDYDSTVSGSQNTNEAKNPSHDENTMGSQGEPDDQVKTSTDEDSLPKRRKMCDKAGKAQLAGMKADEKLERNRENTPQETERFYKGKQHSVEQVNEKRESFTEQASYQAHSQVENSDEIQMSPVQKGAASAEVFNKKTVYHSKIEENADLKPTQPNTVARQDQKKSSDDPQNNRTDETLIQTKDKTKHKGKLRNPFKRNRSKKGSHSHSAEESSGSKAEEPKDKMTKKNKKGIENKHEDNTQKGDAKMTEQKGGSKTWFKINKLRKSSNRVDTQSEEGSSKSKVKNTKSNSKRTENQHEEGTQKGDDEKTKKKASLNCFG